jgi:PDZ domain-containing protein
MYGRLVCSAVLLLSLGFVARTPQGGPPGLSGDPALLRRELLAKMDAKIDANATQAHLDARLLLDDVIPLPYLGIDADPVPGGMKLNAVYGLTGAEKAGLKVGDVLVKIGDDATDSKVAIGKAVRSRQVGSGVILTIQRDGKEMKLAATLGKRPEEDEDEEEQFPDLPGRAPPTATPFTTDFEKDTPGRLPSHFTIALGGHGAPPDWIVSGGEHARVLRQDSADPTGIRFPMLLVDGFDGADLVARVRFRYAGGKVDKAGGLVLRYVDPGNYLVARANAAEGDLRIFRVANGLRRTLPGGMVKGATDDDQWHTLEFRAEGSKLVATLDGKITATAWDSYFMRGRVGLWTKSDSQTEFDDLSFEPISAAPK